MADNVLSAKIVADGGQFTKSLGALTAQLKKFEDGLKKANNPESFNRINRAITETKNRIQSFQTLKDPFSSFTTSTNRANTSLVNFGRVVQDAPFGIIGIANNIDPLVSSFQSLRKETGSTGAAFKSLGAGLLGPAGIAIGVSTITSLLVAFGGSLFGAKKATEISEAALKSYGNTIDDVKDSVEGLTTALQFLNQLGSLNIKITGLGEVTDLREQSIAQREFTQDLQQQREKLLTIQQQIVADTELNAKDREEAMEKNAAALDDINKKIIGSENTQRLLYRQIQLQKNKDAEDAEKKRLSDYEKYANAQIAKAKELASFFNRITIHEIDFDVDPRDSLGQTLEKALAFIDQVLNRRQTFKIKSAALEFEQVDFAFKKLNFKAGAAFEDFAEQVKPVSDELQKIVDRQTKNNPILIRAANIQLEAEAAEKKLLQQVAQLNQSIQAAFAGAIGGFAEGLGEALAGGDIKDAFTGFVTAVGSGIQAIGQQLIQLGLAAEAVKAALKSLFSSPIAMVAAGIALVAIGAAIKKSLSNGVSGRRASGGGVMAGNSYIVGERGQEVFVPNTGGRIIPNNALGSYAGIKGGMQVQVAGAFKLFGKDLVAAIAQTNQSQRRLS